jgi:uncharacterized UPF0160 family protein
LKLNNSSFNETFSSINPSKPWTIKLSSAGLVYVHFGKQVIERILIHLNVDDLASKTSDERVEMFKENSDLSKLVDILFDKMYDQFVKEIDAIDNGVEIGENKK